MPFRDWLYGIAVGGCFLVVTLTKGYGLAQEFQNLPESESASAGSKRATNPNNAEPVVTHFAPGRQVDGHTYRAICDSPKDREHADLCQQWRVAEAANDQFILTGIGLALLTLTLVFTAVAAGAAKAAVKEAKNATAAANRTADGAKRIGEAQVRAYPYFSKVIASGGTGNPDPAIRAKQNGILFFVEIGNAGNSPALNVKFTFRSMYYPKAEFVRTDTGKWHTKTIGSIPPHSGSTASFVPVYPVPVVQKVRDDDLEVEIAVKLDFEDVFGHPGSIDGFYYLTGPDFSVPMASTPWAETP